MSKGRAPAPLGFVAAAMLVAAVAPGIVAAPERLPKPAFLVVGLVLAALLLKGLILGGAFFVFLGPVRRLLRARAAARRVQRRRSRDFGPIR